MVRVPAWWAPGESRWLPAGCAGAWQMEQALVSLLIKELIPSYQDPTLRASVDLIYFLTPNTVTLGLRGAHESRWDTILSIETKQHV